MLIRNKVLVVALAILGLLVAIVRIQIGNLPQEWEGLTGKSNSQIYARLGPPTEDATAKEFVAWTKQYWWGTRELKLISADCCQANKVPDNLFYSVHLRGFYRPVVNQSIENTHTN
ncbi:hypothetical protein [Solilutibacter silvestris]|uniref:hypothetical protein n=1 Tax=Solilutibacter silvestris TaxID=1645665 RepID=UPI003D340C6F